MSKRKLAKENRNVHFMNAITQALLFCSWIAVNLFDFARFFFLFVFFFLLCCYMHILLSAFPTKSMWSIHKNPCSCFNDVSRSQHLPMNREKKKNGRKINFQSIIKMHFPDLNNFHSISMEIRSETFCPGQK